MLLAIEQGNTNTLFAVHDGEKWTAQWRAATHSSRPADEYAVWLSQLLGMAGLALGAFDGCIISSVVPQSIFNLRNLARRYFHVEPMVIGENVDLGIEVLADRFEAWRKLWSTQGFAPIAKAWTTRALGLGERCEARLPNRTLSGVAEGMDLDGALRLRLDDGALERITAGDVFFGGA